jgi:ankyrin repeat protein
MSVNVNHLFSLSNSVAGLTYCLDLGLNPNYLMPEWGLTPLAVACRDEDIEAVRLLLKRGADANFMNPLFCTKSVEIARLLVEKGAQVTAKAAYNNTLLHVACLIGDSDLAAYYLALGLSLNEENEFGQTAVHYACMRLVAVPEQRPLQSITNVFSRTRAHVKSSPALPKMESGTPREWDALLIELFIARGGNFYHPDKQGFTADQYAIASGWISELEKMLSGIKYQPHEVFSAFRAAESHIVLDYLAQDIDPNIVERCETLVHRAAIQGDCVVLSELIAHGAKIDERLTPPECSNDALFGRTPLFAVCDHMNSSHRPQAMQMLIAAGAKVNKPCGGYLTPFLRLCEVGHANAIRMMICSAFDQLMTDNIIPEEPENEPYDSLRHYQPRNVVGNLALKTLCQIYLADENSVKVLEKKSEAAHLAYQEAQQNRKHHLSLFEQACKNAQQRSDNTSIDIALQNYLASSKHCQFARAAMIQASNAVIEQITFHRSQEYQKSHQQLREVILCLAGQIKLSVEIKEYWQAFKQAL